MTNANVLKQGFEECLRNHLCGNNISFHDEQDIIKMDCYDIEWTVDEEREVFIAFTEFGTFSQPYDFDFSFDENLQAFYEELRDFLIKESEGAV